MKTLKNDKLTCVIFSELETQVGVAWLTKVVLETLKLWMKTSLLFNVTIQMNGLSNELGAFQFSFDLFHSEAVKECHFVCCYISRLFLPFLLTHFTYCFMVFD